MLKIILMAATFFSAAVTAYAASGANVGKPDEAAVANFLATSGLKAGLDKMPRQLFSQLFANVPSSIPESTKRSLVESYSAAYPEGSITAAAVKAIKTGKDAARIPHLIEIVSSPIARKMTALESKEPTQDELQAFSMTLSTKPPSKERLGLIKELLDETHAIDIFAKIVPEAAKSISLAKSSGCADDMKRIRVELENGRPAIRQAISTGAMVSMLFTYRTVADSELRDYVATYRDPDSKAIHLTIVKTVTDEYLKRWRAFDKTLARIGSDLSDESMFAKSCRPKDRADNSLKTAVSSGVVNFLEKKEVLATLSGKDARSCLESRDNYAIAACAIKYK